jgi:hypothetical protein
VKDVQPLFTCLVEERGGAHYATSEAFPGLIGSGRTSEEAAGSLRRMVLNFYRAARAEGLLIEP